MNSVVAHRSAASPPPGFRALWTRLIDVGLVLASVAQLVSSTPAFFVFVIFALLAIGSFWWTGRRLALRSVAAIGITLTLQLLAIGEGLAEASELVDIVWLTIILGMISAMATHRAATVRSLEAMAEQMDSDMRNLEELHDLGQRLLASHNLDGTITLALARCLAMARLDLGIVRLLDEAQGTFQVVAAQGYRHPERVPTREANADPNDRSRATVQALTTGRIAVVNNVAAEGRCRIFEGEDVETAIVVPVRGTDQVIGSLMLASRTPRQFQPSELHLLEAMGSQIGLAIQKARLFEKTREAYADLRATEQHRGRLAAIVEATPDMVVIADALGGWKYVNRAGRQLLGIAPSDDLSDVTIFSHRPDWAVEVLRDQALPVMFRDGVWVGETAYLSPDGRETPVLEVAVAHRSASGDVDYFSLLARDIRERALALETLEQSEASFRLLFHDNPQPMMVYDRASLRFIEANSAAVQHYGYTRDELLQMTVLDILLPEKAAEFRRELATNPGIRRFRPGRRHRLKDGRVIDVDITAHSLPFAGHDAILAVIHDVTERTQAEMKLQESTAELQALFAAMTDVVFVVDRNGLHLRVAPTNPSGSLKNPQMLLGKTVREVLPPTDAETIMSYIHCALETGQMVHGEYRIRPRNEDVWFECTVSPISCDAVFWVARDVTARKHIEEALRSSESSFRQLFRDNPLPMWVYDPTSLRFLEANEAAISHYGYSRSELMRMRVSELTAVDEASTTRFEKKASPATQPELTMHRTKNGAVIDVEVSSHPLTFAGQAAVLVVARDVTERRRAAEGLARLASIVESSSDAIVSVDLDRRIVSWNAGAERLYGYTAEEAIGQPIAMVALPGRRHLPITAGQRLDKGERIEQFECPLLRKDGQAVEAALTVSAIRDHEGNLIGTSSIARDISSTKKSEADLKESNRRLEEALHDLRSAQQQVIQQERLRALGQMASGIAHDFNNALSPILGFSELLLARPEQLEQTDVVQQYLELMNTAAKDAAAVVSRLREFYRFRDQDDFAVLVNLDQVVSEAISLTQPKWRDQALADGITISLETEFESSLSVRGGATELRELLTNLIFNAVDAMPDGGTISIQTCRRGDQVVLRVEDTGVGMSDQARQRCLEPFFSTKGERGTGLGLSMVHGIVMRHGGVLEIESQVGKGTTIIVSLPLAQESRHTNPHGGDEPAVIRPQRILVVDDEPLVRQVVAELLASDGHAVVQAANGLEALEKLGADHFDAIVTDRAMPGMNGDQLAVSAKRTQPEMPVILLTGFGDMMEAGGERPAGVDVVVSKPPTLAALRQGLRDALVRSQAA